MVYSVPGFRRRYRTAALVGQGGYQRMPWVRALDRARADLHSGPNLVIESRSIFRLALVDRAAVPSLASFRAIPT